MRSSSKCGWFGLAFTAAVAVSACAAEPAPEDEGAEATLPELDSLAEQDVGASWNGWTQNTIAGYCIDIAWQQWAYHELVRSYGDNSRGGGACLTIRRQPLAYCSSDADCLGGAQSTYGGSAYGYCNEGVCHDRPGSQATYCGLSPNRGPGDLIDAGWQVGQSFAHWFVVGCMTKTAGPNTACGGTNTSLYMRTNTIVLGTNCL
jgi:hypothetical protein